MSRILGIDLGTSNSCAAIVRGGRPELIMPSDTRGLRVTPTVIGFPKEQNGKVIVGSVAASQRETNPAYTFTGLKRLIGRSFDDPHIAEFAKVCSFEIIRGPNGAAWVQGPDAAYSPEELLSHVIKKLKTDAQDRLGEAVTHCVISVPAHFDMSQRAATARSASLAGLEVVRIISEPTAAALAYGMNKADKSIIAVYDFGGGTFDVTILKVDGGDFKPLGSSGDSFLGGMDFDSRLANWLSVEFANVRGFNPMTEDVLARQRLLEKAEIVKCQLSSIDRAPFVIKYLARDPETLTGIDLEAEIDRDTLEQLCADLIERSSAPCEEAMRAAKVKPSQISDVVLVGGMTAMPAIRAVVQSIFGRPPRADINPDEAVAFGCAIMGAALQGAVQSVSLNEKLAVSIGIEDSEGKFVPILKRGDALPVEKSFKFTQQFDGQQTMAAPIYEGERPVATDNRRVGLLVLDGLVDAKSGDDAQFKVTLMADLAGVLTAKLEDMDFRHPIEYSLRVHTESGMTDVDLAALQAMEDA